MKQQFNELRDQKWRDFCGKNNLTDEDEEDLQEDDEFENDLNLDFHLNYM